MGFNTPQLNRDYAYGPNDATNQIRRLSAVGYFHTNITSVNLLRALAHPTNEAVSVEYRARSYLEANCASCHFPGGAVPASFDARIFTPLSSTHLINGAPANTFGNPLNVIVRPGVLSNSLLYARMATRGPTQMPPLASTIADTQGVAVIVAWIESLAGYQTFAEWQLARFGTNLGAGVGAEEDFDGDGAGNYFEYLTGTEPTNAAAHWSGLTFSDTGGAPAIQFERLPNRGFQVHVSTDLVHGAWLPLDAPENRPVFSAMSEWVALFDPAATNGGARHYRLGVFEP